MRQSPTDIYPNVNFTLVTTKSDFFTNYYNQTLSLLKYDMNCVRDNYYNVGLYG
jgi:hypothetical protein